jgi:hypothetical protein
MASRCYVNRIALLSRPSVRLMHEPAEVAAFERRAYMPLILVILLIVLLLGALPTWPYSRGWGYYPSSGLGLVLLILIILLLAGRL